MSLFLLLVLFSSITSSSSHVIAWTPEALTSINSLCFFERLCRIILALMFFSDRPPTKAPHEHRSCFVSFFISIGIYDHNTYINLPIRVLPLHNQECNYVFLT